jgi:hypothetical protein
MWAVSGLLSRGRVGSIDDGIRSTMQALFIGRVGLTDDVTRAITLALFGLRVGLTEEGTGSTTDRSGEQPNR